MVELRAGDLAATWLPEHGMVGMSLRHEGDELLGQRGGLDAYLANGSAFGVPLLAPWANRLDGLRYGHVDLDPARVKGGTDGLPKDGAMAGRRWVVEVATTTSVAVRFDAACAGYEDVLAVFPFPHAWRVLVTLTDTTMTVRTELSATGDLEVPVSFGCILCSRCPAWVATTWRCSCRRWRDRCSTPAVSRPPSVISGRRRGPAAGCAIGRWTTSTRSSIVEVTSSCAAAAASCESHSARPTTQSGTLGRPRARHSSRGNR